MLSLLISGGGIEHCDGSSTGTVSVGQPHCDSCTGEDGALHDNIRALLRQGFAIGN